MANMCYNIYYQIASIAVVLGLLTTTSVSAANSDVYNKLVSFKVIPDILDDQSVDLFKLEAHGNSIKPGDSVPVRNFKSLDMAKVSWPSADPNSKYAVILLDLDRKTVANNTHIAYNLFTSINIPGQLTPYGQAIVAYEPPHVPCQPSMKHRILAITCSQVQNIDLVDVVAVSASAGQTKKRENFELKEFLKSHSLEVVAANIFYAAGESGALCSGGSSPIRSMHSLTSSLLAMVIVAAVMKLSKSHTTA